MWNKDPLSHKASISYADSFSSGFPNLALNKPASQSSDPGWGGPASKAVDGNISGNWANGSVTHTNNDSQAWWQVDLGSMQSIQTVRVWNRADCCSERLTNFNVYLLNESQAVVASVNVPGQAGSPTTVQISGSARYVKVQLSGADYLSLAEVEVLGTGYTYAYPTQITDADNFSSTMQYNYGFGAVTRTQGPPPAGQTQGMIQTMLYDAAGRLERVTTDNNGAYTRWVYSDYSYVSQFDTIQEGQGERYTTTVWDGGGRVRAVGGSNPGSTGGYWGKFNGYDVMGRLTNSTNPTEITGGWAPAGDDSAGWILSYQSYDWKGRPLVTTNQDGTQKYASYGGCGCAGGEVATFSDEVGRQQKVYSDVLGRQWKTEVLNWNGSVYATTTNSFNARDQVTLLRQYQGTDQSTTYQDTTMSYDGYGRLKTKHVPEQNAGTATVYAYNLDDTIHSVTDARGASATYGYNNRHLVTGITYSAPQGITPTSNVSFAYDAAGNRTSMADGTGNLTYQYDVLSRLTAETRQFSGAGAPSGSYILSYQYNLAGQLKKITDPTNVTINYNYDSAGRIVGVTGENNLVNNVSQYASNFVYRAWDAVKDKDYGSGGHSHVDYNARLLPVAATRTNTYLNPNGTMTWNHEYYADGRIQRTSDTADNRFDRLQEYDHVGRLKEAYSGREARGLAPTSPADNPYRQSMQYDVWDNMTSKSGRVWRQSLSDSSTYINNRRQYWSYDAEGHVLGLDGKAHTYDAGGKQTLVVSMTDTVGGGGTGHPIQPGWEIAQTYEAGGQPVKRLETRRAEELIGEGPQTNITETVTTTYYLYSSVLEAKVVELDGNGVKTKGYVYANEERLAKQEVNQSSGAVRWYYPNAETNSWVEEWDGGSSERQEMDPMGAELGTSDPYVNFVNPGYRDINPPPQQLYIDGGDPFDYSGGYEIDGMPVSASEFNRRLRSDSLGIDYFIHDRAGFHFEQGEILSLGPNASHIAYPKPDNEGWHWGVYTAFIQAEGQPQKRKIGGGSSGPFGGKTSGAVPCDVVISDVNQRDLIATLRGEAFHPGDPLYTHATNDGRGNSSHEAAKHPDSYATEDDIDKEMQHMVSVFENRRRDWGGLSWSATAHTRQTNGKYQFEGYPNGLNALNNLGDVNSDNCKQARRALRAMEEVNAFAPINRDIHFWHGVLQSDKAGPFVRVRNGALRIGGSDFW